MIYMVNPGLLVGGAGLFLTMQERQRRKELEAQMADPNVPDDEIQMPADLERLSDIETDADRTARAVERLADIESIQGPGPEDKDAYADASFSLNDGETATVTVTPDDGFNLRVKVIYFDRKADHDYTFNVGGEVTSVTHQTKYTKPKLVSQSDVVLAEVTNNSGSSTVIDFEMEAWAEAVR